MNVKQFLTEERAHLVIALVVVALLASLVIGLFAAAKPREQEPPFTPYAERYRTQLQSINSGAGVYQENHYTAPGSNTLIPSPRTGAVLADPLLSTSAGGESAAGATRASGALGNAASTEGSSSNSGSLDNAASSGSGASQRVTSEGSLSQVARHDYVVATAQTPRVYARLTHPSQAERNSVKGIEAAILSLAYDDGFQASVPQQFVLYNNANREELVDSALLFASSSTEQTTNWQESTSLYLIDGELTSHAAAILPGVNILNKSDEQGRASGVLYTNRSLALGSLPTIQQDEPALRALEAEASHERLDTIETLRMDTSQRITGTDLIFTAPEGATRISTIQAPAAQGTTPHSFVLEGGVIAVGRGAVLTVGSGTIGEAEPTSEGGTPVTGTHVSVAKTKDDAPPEGSIELSPRSLIIDGGTVILSDTSEKGKLVISADIQVRNGGVLQIGTNVVINGNVYVFGNGALEVKGNFVLKGHSIALATEEELTATQQVQALATKAAETGERISGGLFIFGASTLSAEGTPLGTGYFNAQLLWNIEASSDGEPLPSSHVAHFFSLDSQLIYRQMYHDYCCTAAAQNTYLCEHLGTPNEEGVLPNTQLGFSEDGALVELIVLNEVD